MRRVHAEIADQALSEALDREFGRGVRRVRKPRPQAAPEPAAAETGSGGSGNRQSSHRVDRGPHLMEEVFTRQPSSEAMSIPRKARDM